MVGDGVNDATAEVLIFLALRKPDVLRKVF